MDSLDLIQIHQLLGAYGHFLDARDWDRFAALFEPDAVIDYTPVRAPKVYTSIKDALAYFYEANHPGAHHTTNIVAIPADPDEQGRPRATVHSKFLVPFSEASHTPHRWYGGDYHDLVVQHPDATWHFASRTCHPRWLYATP